MRWICLLGVGGVLFAFPIPAAEPGVSAQFVGGTVPGITAKSSARIDLASTEYLLLHARKTDVRIDYRKIHTVEYGQSVSRRYAEAVLISPVLLLAKSRKHFVTLGYVDESGGQQAIVFRVGKGDIRSVLASLEARTGRRVEYQDDEARKAGH
ncbi:MAG: hypothetical protein LAP40_13150 [Acidobacteriia bacterium]|nr:hypothetical protein [Terriglobia bacterium]